MANVTFVDQLPPRERARVRDGAVNYAQVLEDLQEQPGEWAKVSAYASANAANVARWRATKLYGRVAEFERRGCEVFARAKV